jgi:hypothetical protein
MAKKVRNAAAKKTIVDEAAAHADIDTLLEAYLDATMPMLQKDHFVMAIGMQLSMAGKPSFIALQPEPTEGVIDMKTHLQAYRTLLRQQTEHDGKAALLAYDVRLRDDRYNDAINIELEHYTGARVTLLLPYRFKGLFKKLETGDIRRIPPDADPIM